jgi:single-stranded-DNA-specific exonuclease
LSEANIPWLEPTPVEVPNAISSLVGGPPFLAEALVRRGLVDTDRLRGFLDPKFYTPALPAELPDLALAADRLEQAIRSGEHIGVWGDFDVDGQTATTLLIQALRSLGANTSYYIPIRARDSHGVALPALKDFLATGIDLLLTCDTGITAHAAADFARSQKVDLIITDHHLLADTLPDALAVVNPQRLPAGHPLATLCGVGCAYKLAEECLRRANRGEEAARLLDLVALGTVSDLALLLDDNRYLVQSGLERLRSEPRPAIVAMLEQSRIDPAQITEEQISFTLAPRLNALGRLDDANPAVPFLLAASAVEARPMAARLEALNARRKLLCDQVFQACQAQLSQDRSLLDHPVLILGHPAWPAGVLGIVASRLVDLYRRPVILLATPAGEVARGSARSVEGINITQAITTAESLLTGYGGHPMAAGLALEPAKIPDMHRAVDQSVAQQQAATHVAVADLVIDAFVPLGDLSIEMVELLDRLAPFGPANPPLILASQNLKLQNQVTFGKNGEHLRLMVEDNAGVARKVTWWQGAGSPLPEERFDLAYTVHSSHFRGKASVEIEWVAIRILPESLPLRSQRPIQTIQDERHQLDPLASLRRMLEKPDTLVYAEGEHSLPDRAVDRCHLSPAANLIFWSVPPGRSELLAILDQVAPRQVTWFGIATTPDKPETFLNRLSGLVRFALKQRAGRVVVSDLSTATGQREQTVRLGLAWLAARGHITIQPDGENELQIYAGGAPDPAAAARIERDLVFMLQETTAFRAFCQKVDLRLLFE